MKYLLTLSIATILLSCSIQNNSTNLSTTSKDINIPLSSFPFELRDDNQLYIQVRVNGVDSLTFNIDTGASSYVVVDSVARNRLKLTFDGEDTNIGASSITTVKSSSDNKIEIGNVKLENLTLYSIPYQNVDFDGILGCEFFLDYIVDINFDRRTIELYDPKIYKYSGNKKRLEVKMDDGLPLIKSSFRLKNTLIEDWFLLDTGADDRISFNSSAVTNLKLEEKLIIVGSSTSMDSNGNISKSQLGLINEIKISDYSFYNVIAGLTKSQTGKNSDNSHIGAFGNVVLSKMNIIYDLGNNCLYLGPKYLK